MSRRFIGNILLVCAMGLGLLTGALQLSFFQGVAQTTSELFLRLLKLISLPIIFLSITSTISGMKDFKEMRRLGRKVLTYTIGTTVVAAAIALVLFLLVNPAKTALHPDELGLTEITKQGSYLSFLINIIPSNLVEAFAVNNVIGVALISIMLSVAILFLPKGQKEFLHTLFSSLFGALLKITGCIITLMPLAIWAFVHLLITDLRANFEHLSSLMLYLACVVGANLIQGLVILPLMLKWKKISPLKSLKGMAPALTVAFFSKSSNATLPIAMRCAEKNLGVSPKISSFTLPLCSVINMNGCAAFILITSLFVATINGFTFGAFELVGWIFIATLAAIGNAGVPMGCFFLTSALLIGMNVPLYLMGLILPFYTIIDMIETTLNIWSDGCITTAVDKDLAEEASALSEQATEVF